MNDSSPIAINSPRDELLCLTALRYAYLCVAKGESECVKNRMVLRFERLCRLGKSAPRLYLLFHLDKKFLRVMMNSTSTPQSHGAGLDRPPRHAALEVRGLVPDRLGAPCASEETCSEVALYKKITATIEANDVLEAADRAILLHKDFHSCSI
jgi:hypothetical protein